MKSTMTIVGILLILFGIVGFAYQGFSYTKNEKVADIGGIQVSADVQKTVFIPPILSGLSIAAGLFLVVMGRIKK